jgi:hypothetical protein
LKEILGGNERVSRFLRKKRSKQLLTSLPTGKMGARIVFLGKNETRQRERDATDEENMSGFANFLDLNED